MSLDVQSISLDISKQPTPQQVRLGQGDANATQLIVSIFDDGEVYSLDDYSVRLAMRLPNSDNYYEAQGAAAGNVATFDIDETYAATSYGIDGFGYVDVLDGETVICSTSRFQLVVLRDAQDGADPSTAYSNGIIEATERAIAAAEAAEGVVLQDVPTMSATIKGGALLGDGLSVVDETLSLSGESFTTAEKTKLAGIEDGANNYALPTMDSSTKGGAKLGSGLSVSNDTLSLDLPTMSANTKGGAKLGAGLSVANDVLSVDASSIDAGALPVAHGGTGATSESGALVNLNVAPIAYGFLTGIRASLNLSQTAQKVEIDTFTGSGCSKSSYGIKVANAGSYLITAQVYLNSGFTVADIVHVTCCVNNSNTIIAEMIERVSTTNPYEIHTVGPVIASLSANDVVYLYAYNQTAARGVITDRTASNNLTIVRIA